jgi:RHS repeat-associated protein
MFFNDPIGTPVRLIESAGKVAEDLDLSPWGARSGSKTDVRFLGQWADEETGLSYNRLRYYDPELGMFISPDAIELEGGTDPFGGMDDPFTDCDPTGESSWPICQNPRCRVECVKPRKWPHGGPTNAYQRRQCQREWQLDHITSQNDGGEYTAENCRVLCRKCNRKKGSESQKPRKRRRKK